MKLIDEYIVPPFSILDTKQGYWQQRKRKWIELGIQGEAGRSSELIEKGNCARNEIPNYSNKTTYIYIKEDYLLAAKNNRYLDEKTQRALSCYSAPNGAVQKRTRGSVTGTSVFDPVLAEVVYRWFSKQGDAVLDPFAGESTKGIVASVLNRKYTGVELRNAQVEENYRQARIVNGRLKFEYAPTWIEGDSSNIDSLVDGKYDLLFTSPPYFNLEVYSGGEADGSCFKDYCSFIVWYQDIISKSVQLLNDNRFAVFKVGEIRDSKGEYYNFVSDTIKAFINAGCHYYNDIVLLTAIGSSPVRAHSTFRPGRKVVKVHQNVLVFYKGDVSKVKNSMGYYERENDALL